MASTAFTLSDVTGEMSFACVGNLMKITSTAGNYAGFVAAGDTVIFASHGNGEQITGSPVNLITIEQP